MPDPIGVDDELFVLSYNVCWQCMEHAETGSAAKLGGECEWVTPQQEKTVCAANIASLIDRIVDLYQGVGYDFVALQEASRWEELAKLSSGLRSLEPVAKKVGKEWAATFYDAAKYELTHSFAGDSGSEYAFLVLIFEPSELIFVNVHNCHTRHGCDIETLELALVRGLRTLKLPPETIDGYKGFRIVVAGDFNESRGSIEDGAMSWTPFGSAGIPTEVRMVDSQLETCCPLEDPWEPWRPGDYIFDSAGPASPEIPEGFDKNVIKSDHWPVVAKLAAPSAR